MKEDLLYHFSLGTGTHDFLAMFGDVKVQALPASSHFGVREGMTQVADSQTCLCQLL